MLQSPGVGSVQDVIAIGPSSASTTALTLTNAGDSDQAVATLRAAMRDQQLGAGEQLQYLAGHRGGHGGRHSHVASASAGDRDGAPDAWR